MSKEEKIAELLEGMDKRTKHYKKTKEYFDRVSRKSPDLLGKTKTFRCIPMLTDGSVDSPIDYGLDAELTVEVGYCPCSLCGHKFMWECEEANDGRGCDCCSSACT